MNKFIEIWTVKAQTKTITRKDVIARCIFKTMNAKSESKEEVLKHYLGKAFTAGKICQHRRYPYASVYDAVWEVESDLKHRNKILGVPSTEFLTTVEEIELFNSLLSIAENYGRM